MKNSKLLPSASILLLLLVRNVNEKTRFQVSTQKLYVHYITVLLINFYQISNVFWTPMMDIRVQETKVRKIFGDFVHVTFSQKLRVHATSMTVALTWTPMSI